MKIPFLTAYVVLIVTLLLWFLGWLYNPLLYRMMRGGCWIYVKGEFLRINGGIEIPDRWYRFKDRQHASKVIEHYYKDRLIEIEDYTK